MCGRYTLTDPEFGTRLFLPSELGPIEVAPELREWRARYNICPSQAIPVISMRPRGSDHGPVLSLMHWGLVPSWADPKSGPKPINARSETVAGARTFRDAFRRRRCLVPADGFYEWQTSRGVKTPHWFSSERVGLLLFAGIWETWTDPDRRVHESVAILTREASPVVAPVHGRMPVILAPGELKEWLRPDAPITGVERLLRDHQAHALQLRPVSRKVNSPAQDSPELIEPQAPASSAQGSFAFTQPSESEPTDR